MMKILAFDQATIKTGYALIEKGTEINDIALKEYGVIDLHKVKNVSTRNAAMVLNIFRLIKDFSPDVVVIEDVALQKNASSLIALSRIQGAIMGYCYLNGYGCSLVIKAPSNWRHDLAFSQGRGVQRANLKKQAQDKVKEMFGIEATEDEADAICIGMSVALSNVEEELTNG